MKIIDQILNYKLEIQNNFENKIIIKTWKSHNISKRKKISVHGKHLLVLAKQ